MVVGIDTFVDAKTSGKTSCKANGALVASYDPQATKWYRYEADDAVGGFPREKLVKQLTRQGAAHIFRVI